MLSTEYMLKGLEPVTGIKLQRDDNGFVNITHFLEEYKKKYPNEFKQRFGDATGDQIIEMF
jgi:hypothetical protein